MLQSKLADLKGKIGFVGLLILSAIIAILSFRVLKAHMEKPIGTWISILLFAICLAGGIAWGAGITAIFENFIKSKLKKKEDKYVGLG